VESSVDPKRPRVAIWGHYHGRNLGDDVVVAAIAQNLRRRVPDVDLIGISLAPDDTRTRHGFDAYPLRRSAERPVGRIAAAADTAKHALRGPLRWRPLHSLAHRTRATLEVIGAILGEPAFLWRSWLRLTSCDLVVVAGSGPVSDDWLGPWSHPYTILKWSLLARLRRTPFVFLAVGAGPIDHRLSRAMLRPALRLAAHRSFRDESSARCVEALHVDGKQVVAPDLAFSHHPPDVPSPWAREVPVVGLNPIPYFDERYWPSSDKAAYEAYLDKLADFAEWVLSSGRRLVLLYSQTAADPLVCDDLAARLAARGVGLDDDRVERPRIEGVDDLYSAIARCDYVVAGRFHCILLPYLVDRPAVGLAYHSKTFDLMSYVGQGDFSLDVATFDVSQLRELALRLERTQAEARAGVQRRLPGLRQALDVEYERLVHILAVRDASTGQPSPV
jgi:polysaccharide pyruvyl transferase WcaK-like protein